MKYIGAHVDSLPDICQAPYEARLLGARAFAFNLVDPKDWHRPKLLPEVAERFRRLCAEYGFSGRYILPHASFMMNLASPEPRKLASARRNLLDEVLRCQELGIEGINFHPGSHLGEVDDKVALCCIAQSIDYVLERSEGVTAVIENTAGQGNSLGYNFRQLAYIISKVRHTDRVAVCIDSCHAFVAGYDLRTPEVYEQVWDEFDSVVGFDRLWGMHINDSDRALGSRIDRHQAIGKGLIGATFFELLMADPRFDDMPLILETPNVAEWQADIAWLYSLADKTPDTEN